MGPKLNEKETEHGNEAYNDLEVDETYVARIKKDCKQFVGLDMQADPKIGAFAYFFVAIRENDQEMMVQERPRKEGATTSVQNKHPLSIYDFKDAEGNYDSTYQTIVAVSKNG